MIADWCRELAGFPESVWIAYAQSREPLRRLVTSEDYANHFHAASFCGVEMARQVRGDWGDISCRELAEKLNVKLEWPAMPDGVGMLTFACYFEPDRILVYTDNAAATRSLIQESGGVEFLGDVDIGEMLLAHELCHVLQHRQPELYTNRKHIRLQKIGPWERTGVPGGSGRHGLRPGNAAPFPQPLCVRCADAAASGHPGGSAALYPAPAVCRGGSP